MLKNVLFITMLFSCGVNSNIISLEGVDRIVKFKSYVYVAVDASKRDTDIAIIRQIKSALGALNKFQISLHNMENPLREENYIFKEEIVDVQPAHCADEKYGIKRVSYAYSGRAVMNKEFIEVKALEVTLLADDYTKHSLVLMENCSARDFVFDDADTFWYYYRPEIKSCEELIQQERQALHAAHNALVDPNTISYLEAKRWFINVDILIVEKSSHVDHEMSPDYYDLYDNKNSSEVVLYVLTNAELDSVFPYDRFGLEHAKFLDQLLGNYSTIDLAAYRDSLKIIISQKTYPYQLVGKAMQQIADKWISWDVHLIINSRTTVVKIRSYYGDNNMSESRFKEAFKLGNIVIFNGHSYLGEGPLKATNYFPEDFNNRYQIFVFNSCNSFSYYNQGYFDLKSETKNNLHLVTNGLGSLIENSGLVMAAFINGLFNRKTYTEILLDMNNASPHQSNELRLVDRL